MQEVDTLLSIVGSDVGVADATCLLELHKGCVQAAVNAYFDPPASRDMPRAPSQPADKANAPGIPPKAASGGRAATQSSPARHKSVKRTASGKASGSPASKMHKQQKSITSFFQGGAPMQPPMHGVKAKESASVDHGPTTPGQAKVPETNVGTLVAASGVEVDAQPSRHRMPADKDTVEGLGYRQPDQDCDSGAKASDTAAVRQQHDGTHASCAQADAAAAIPTVPVPGCGDACSDTPQGLPSVHGSHTASSQAITVTTTAAIRDTAAQFLPLDKYVTSYSQRLGAGSSTPSTGKQHLGSMVIL